MRIELRFMKSGHFSSITTNPLHRLRFRFAVTLLWKCSDCTTASISFSTDKFQKLWPDVPIIVLSVHLHPEDREPTKNEKRPAHIPLCMLAPTVWMVQSSWKEFLFTNRIINLFSFKVHFLFPLPSERWVYEKPSACANCADAAIDSWLGHTRLLQWH